MKYSKAITQEICEYIRAGNTFKDSAALAGISKATFFKWKKDKKDFLDSIKKAELECKARNIGIIQKAAIKTWQAAAWYLERRYNSQYALKQINELHGKGGGAVQVNVIKDYLSKPAATSSSAGSTKGSDKV